MGRSSSLVKHLTSILLDKEIRIVKPNGNRNQEPLGEGRMWNGQKSIT